MQTLASRTVAYGLTVLSQLAVGLPADPQAEVDLVLDVGDESILTGVEPVGKYLAGSPPGEDFLTLLVGDGNGYLLRVRDLTDVRLSPDASRATCHPAPGIGRAHLKELAATIISFVLPLRSTVALHGSCVVGVPGLEHVGGAVAIIGGPAAGKSTLAGYLCAAGAVFVTDDLLPVRSVGPDIAVVGGCPELRVRPAATDLMGALSAYPTRLTVDGRSAFYLGSPLATYPTDLGLVLMPEAVDAGGQTSVRRVPPREAALSLLRMGRSGGWALPEVHRMYFSAVASIAGGVPVLEVKWSPATFRVENFIALVRGELVDRS